MANPIADMIKRFFAGGAKPAGEPNGAVVAGRTKAEAEATKPVNSNHQYYGNPTDEASQYRNATAARILKENQLRHAYDPNKKALRVTCVDEQF